MDIYMKKEQLFNYLGSLVFVSLILLFLFSLVFISRIALDDSSGLQSYVESTKTLLDDIDKVQKEVESINSTSTRIDLKNIEVFDNTYGVTDSSYLNIADTGAFFTLKFGYPIIEYAQYYVLDVDSAFNYSKGQRVVYLMSEGIVVENNIDSLEIYNLNTARITTIQKSDVMGVVIYETNK
jgi:hypothetical protein